MELILLIFLVALMLNPSPRMVLLLIIIWLLSRH